MPFRVAIIGGGFSGAVVALQLCRHLRGQAAIDVVEPRAMLGGGVAYSAADPAHRINVPAARMTVFRDDPAHFDRWARTEGELDADPHAMWLHDMIFPRRRVFGRYVAGLVRRAARERPDITLRHHATTATEVAALPGGYSVQLADGAALTADAVVLAVSHPPPSVPGPLRRVLAQGGRVVADPWAPGALDGIAPDADVLIVGTGLTMADVVASLDARGHRGRITAFSRRGLLSRGHPPFHVAKRTWFETATPPASARALVDAVRCQVAQAAEEGMPWQAVFDDIRLNARRLWQALPLAEQRRLVRHVRPFWDVHRFRVAPQAEAAIARLRDAGRFVSVAASLVGADAVDGRVEVTLRRRGAPSAALVRHLADAVIVTTGPGHGEVIAANPALASLARQGLACMDRTGLGLEVDEHSRAVGPHGAARDTLFVAGPLARGRFGELMGLPQVSEHAEAVAIEVAGLAAAASRAIPVHNALQTH